MKHALALAISALLVFTTAIVPAEEKFVIRAAGSTLLANGVQDSAKSYEAKNPSVGVTVSGGGTTRAFQMLADKHIEIALASRVPSKAEDEVFQSRKIKIERRVITHGGLPIVVHPENPVKELTLDQVGKIFSGEITSWKLVGGPDAPIAVHITDPAKHGTPGYIQELLMKGAPFAPGAKMELDYVVLMKNVGASQNAIGFSLLTKASDMGDKIKRLAIKKDASSPAVVPSWETVQDKTYPLTRPLYFYWDGGSVARQVQDFIDFCEKNVVELR
jgi:phosphate transport system substrate-binding protein